MKNNTAFIFPGQGSQYKGMADYFSDQPVAQNFFKVFRELMKYDFTILSEEELSCTLVTQPVLFTLSCIHFEWLMSKSIQAYIVAGHSLGEYSALYAAGALSFEEGLDLVAYRGKLMHEVSLRDSGKMAAIIGLHHDAVSAVCRSCKSYGIVEAVNINSDKQIVISGSHKAVDMACIAAKEAGAKRALPLPVSAPFHSSLMRQIREAFEEKLSQVTIKKPQRMMVQNVDASVHQDPQKIKANLLLQLYSPVQWVRCMAEMHARGTTHFLECGPGKVLSSLARSQGYESLSSEELIAKE